MIEDQKGGAMDESRLTRIETKLDRLAEGFENLIRLEERSITLFKRMDAFETRVEKLIERIAALEKVNTARGPMFIWLERAGIAFIGAVIAWYVNQRLGD